MEKSKMNEEIIEKLFDISNTEIPLAIQETITWGIYSNLVMGIIFMTMALLFSFIIYNGYLKYTRNLDAVDYFMSAVMIILLFIPSVLCFESSAKAYFTPRAYIVGKINK
jgi:hypothetical protein